MGPAADHIDAFADWLHLHGYRPTSINNLLRSLAAWTDWMLAAGFTAQEFLGGLRGVQVGTRAEATRSLQPRTQSLFGDGRLCVHPVPPTSG